MMPLVLDGAWLLFFAVWPLFGLCSNITKIDYLCGVEGVQIQVEPGFLGKEVTFLVRDEFGMAYNLDGCVSKCVFSAKKPNGENIFFVSYHICISFREEESWNLRVRLFGSNKTEDIDIVCPKSKKKKPRMITQKPRSTRVRQMTTVPTWTTSLSSSSTQGHVGLSTKPGGIQGEGEVKPTTTPGKGLVTKEVIVTTTSPLPIVGRLTTSTTFPGILNESQCIVPSERFPCLDSSVSREECLRYRCCYDPKDHITPCYYGQRVTVNCSSDGSFQMVISRHVTSPPLLLTSVVLGLGTCPPPVIIGDFLVIKGQVQACSTSRFVQGQLVYEFSITAKQDILVSPSGSITRDSTLVVTSLCPYNFTLSLTLVSSVELPSPFPSVTNSGVLEVELRIAKGSAYSEFYTSIDYPVQIPLRELIFFEVVLLQPSDPRLHLRLHHCWGTPNKDPESTVRWPLVYDGCPFTEDDPVTKILPGPIPSSYQRFVVSAFRFLDYPSQSQVYVFCSVSVCVPSSNETCTTDCIRLRRGRRFEPDYSHHLVKTSGPLVFRSEAKTGLASLQHLTAALPAILFAVALLVLLCLVTILRLRFMVQFRRNLNVK
ncbi:zona pellucida sperm-binding protein 4-like isoform X1 [Pyxicephalus adspersus]|uniref:zona pellucida sperm-binding protein 4-like isoform X1 n=1 Tax=Pyxicephalus adspersus TaxID=30357 RepID=UPI003B5BAF14